MSVPKASDADLRRAIPSVEQVRQRPAVKDLEERFGRDAVLTQLRRLLDEARTMATEGDRDAMAQVLDGLGDRLRDRLERDTAPSLIPVINATGVVVHTNLGRAPLPPDAAARVAEIASSYCNLEYDLEEGERGNREVHAEVRLRRMLGAEGALVVNNNAAAVLLAVNTFAEGREVLVSRGELVEIGGSFRVPDVLRKGGARLREVGTTNRTGISDYRAALGPETGMILKVHPSNYRIVGFTQTPSLRELAALAKTAGLPLVEDLGSGLMAPLPGALSEEPTVAESLALGADVVSFSGDKLLGGPQAGLVVGTAVAADAMRRNPLYRALRVDKMTLASLDVVLGHYVAGRADSEIPVLRMLCQTAEEIALRAEAFAKSLAAACPGGDVALASGASVAGGGSAPVTDVPTTLLTIGHRSAHELAAALRAGQPPVVARVAEGRLVLDLRTVRPEEEAALRDALVTVLTRV
jgi:L-seryl-tRNA(Ser) seleniumtransferase